MAAAERGGRGEAVPSKRHEMVLARAKHEHEDKLHKNKAELLQTAINEEVEKHIEAAYKDYLERGRGEGAGAAGGGAGARKGDPSQPVSTASWPTPTCAAPTRPEDGAR